jgi:hypothetical protein
MSFATTSNIVTVILCIAVLVQSMRMMRSLAAFKAADLPATVQALETATGHARQVLSELKDVLRREADPSMRRLGEAEAIRDELKVMIDIANATADRLMDSASAARKAEADLAAATAPADAETLANDDRVIA